MLGTDLATMTGHAWTHRAFTEVSPRGAAGWGWCTSGARCRPSPTCLAVARAWERRVGADRVHVVLDPAAVAALVRERRGLAVPAALPAEAGELARRVASVLGLLVVPDVRERLLRDRLRPRVAAAAARVPAGPPLVVPPPHREWLEAAAERMRRGIERAGYAVHGDLDALTPRWPDGSERRRWAVAAGDPRPGRPGAAGRPRARDP